MTEDTRARIYKLVNRAYASAVLAGLTLAAWLAPR